MRLLLVTRLWRGHVQRSGNSLFEREKVFQIIGIVLATEQSMKSFTFIFQNFYLNFKSNSIIFKELMNDSWNDFRRTPHDGCFCYYAIDYNNKTNRKEATSKINIKILQLFLKQRILGVRVTIVQRKASVDLTRTSF